ncbi:MAG: hypothetical protein EOP11_03695 [Proteobacteria bacterium]|nr:MAG: hypothetical protein EOP11_03695 [Pseudomonadota bacterium]
MTKLTLALLSLALLPSAFAEDGKICAAIKSCDVVQVSKVGRKKSTSKNNLKFDELCGADLHSLPLKGGMELELAIVKDKVEAKLKGADGAVLSSKKAALDAKKIAIKYRAKQADPKDLASVDISCKP